MSNHKYKAMTTEKLIESATEAVEIARGEQPAARLWHNGHAYVPEVALTAAQAEIQKVWKATGAVDVVFDEHGTELSEPHEVVEYMRRILKAAQEENARLREALAKAERDVDMAQYGEGYSFNLPLIVTDIRAALFRPIRRQANKE